MRTTPEAVAAIIEVDPAIGLDPFIDAANALVTELCTASGYTDERLEKIEKFLSAHFYTLRDPRPTSETAGDIQEAYQSKVDLFFKTSHYGQMAMALDTKGNLASLENDLEKKRKFTVGLTWVGSRRSYSCQIPPICN